MSTLILGIDPGPTNQGFVLYDRDKRGIRRSGNVSVDYMLNTIRTLKYHFCKRHQVFLAIEQVQNYGMVVGADVFITVRNSGRFQEAWLPDTDRVEFLSYPKVKGLMGLNSRAKESGVRAWMRDRLGEFHDVAPTGLKGLKKKPGPLYGIKDHAWSALAVAIAFDILYLKTNYH